MDGLSLSLHGAAVNHDLGVCHLRFLCTYDCGAGSWQLSLEARALDEDKGETRDGASTNQSFDVVGRAIVHAPQSQDTGPLTSSSHTALDAGALQCGQEYRLRVTARPLACDDSEYTGAGSGQAVSETDTPCTRNSGVGSLHSSPWISVNAPPAVPAAPTAPSLTLQPTAGDAGVDEVHVSWAAGCESTLCRGGMFSGVTLELAEVAADSKHAAGRSELGCLPAIRLITSLLFRGNHDDTHNGGRTYCVFGDHETDDCTHFNAISPPSCCCAVLSSRRLKPGCLYSCRMALCTDIGRGAWSKWSGPIQVRPAPPFAPSAPTVVRCHMRSSKSIAVAASATTDAFTACANWDSVQPAQQQQNGALRAVADLALEWPTHATAFGARGAAVTELILIGIQIADVADSGSDDDAEGDSFVRRADDTADGGTTIAGGKTVLGADGEHIVLPVGYRLVLRHSLAADELPVTKDSPGAHLVAQTTNCVTRVTNLAPDSWYQFRLALCSAAGCSAFSSPSARVRTPPAVPPPPAPPRPALSMSLTRRLGLAQSEGVLGGHGLGFGLGLDTRSCRFDVEWGAGNSLDVLLSANNAQCSTDDGEDEKQLATITGYRLQVALAPQPSSSLDSATKATQRSKTRGAHASYVTHYEGQRTSFSLCSEAGIEAKATALQLIPGGRYLVRVAAQNASGWSRYSLPLSIRMPPMPPPSPQRPVLVSPAAAFVNDITASRGKSPLVAWPAVKDHGSALTAFGVQLRCVSLPRRTERAGIQAGGASSSSVRDAVDSSGRRLHVDSKCDVLCFEGLQWCKNTAEDTDAHASEARSYLAPALPTGGQICDGVPRAVWHAATFLGMHDPDFAYIQLLGTDANTNKNDALLRVPLRWVRARLQTNDICAARCSLDGLYYAASVLSTGSLSEDDVRYRIQFRDFDYEAIVSAAELAPLRGAELNAQALLELIDSSMHHASKSETSGAPSISPAIAQSASLRRWQRTLELLHNDADSYQGKGADASAGAPWRDCATILPAQRGAPAQLTSLLDSVTTDASAMAVKVAAAAAIADLEGGGEAVRWRPRCAAASCGGGDGAAGAPRLTSVQKYASSMVSSSSPANLTPSASTSCAAPNMQDLAGLASLVNWLSIDGLRAGTTYELRVAAHNALGNSNQSPSLKFVTPSAPPAPPPPPHVMHVRTVSLPTASKSPRRNARAKSKANTCLLEFDAELDKTVADGTTQEQRQGDSDGQQWRLEASAVVPQPKSNLSNADNIKADPGLVSRPIFVPCGCVADDACTPAQLSPCLPLDITCTASATPRLNNHILDVSSWTAKHAEVAAPFVVCSRTRVNGSAWSAPGPLSVVLPPPRPPPPPLAAAVELLAHTMRLALTVGDDDVDEVTEGAQHQAQVAATVQWCVPHRTATFGAPLLGVLLERAEDQDDSEDAQATDSSFTPEVLLPPPLPPSFQAPVSPDLMAMKSANGGLQSGANSGTQESRAQTHKVCGLRPGRLYRFRLRSVSLSGATHVAPASSTKKARVKKSRIHVPADGLYGDEAGVMAARQLLSEAIEVQLQTPQVAPGPMCAPHEQLHISDMSSPVNAKGPLKPSIRPSTPRVNPKHTARTPRSGFGAEQKVQRRRHDALMIEWVPPVETGGVCARDLSYIVQHQRLSEAGGPAESPHPKLEAAPTSSTSIRLARLEAGNDYRVRVRAFSPIGRGPWSSWTVLRTANAQEPPPAPLGLCVADNCGNDGSAVTPSSLRFKWNEVHVKSSSVTTTISYELEIALSTESQKRATPRADAAPTLALGVWRQVYRGASTQCEATGLEQLTSYLARVRAIVADSAPDADGGAGAGTWSEVVLGKTAERQLTDAERKLQEERAAKREADEARRREARDQREQARRRNKKGVVSGAATQEANKAVKEKRVVAAQQRETTKTLLFVILILTLLGILGVYLNLTKKKRRVRWGK